MTLKEEKHMGKCVLCGKYTKLTYEHIPPQKAFNSIPAKMVTGDVVINTMNSKRKPWDFSNLKYKNMQRGIGKYSLCKECNNNTGAWYGDEYVNFIFNIYNSIKSLQVKPNDTVLIEDAEFRPLPVFKQIISMFCSVNSNLKDDYRIKRLSEFVVDKTSTDFPKECYKIGMYFFSGGVQRFAPLSVLVMTGKDSENIITLSEIATFPVGFILYFNPKDDFKIPCTDITSFCDCKFDEKYKVQMEIPVHECNIMFPSDFRSRVEIEKCIEENNNQ